MELVVFEKNKLLKKRLNKEYMTELEKQVEIFMHMFCFKEMIIDEDNTVLFKTHKNEIMSIEEFDAHSNTVFMWKKLQDLWYNEQLYTDIKPDDEGEIMEDFRKCFDVAQKLDSMYPDMPGAFTGTVSQRLERHLNRIIKERNMEA